MMRSALSSRTVVLAVVAATCALPALSDVTVVSTPRRTVYLYTNADLAQLQATNPEHYAQAHRILASANHLCRPGKEQIQHANADGRDVTCRANLLRTSNPPKSQVEFTLDDTHYIALVTITDDPPRPTPADSPPGR